jgi:hypothetical protein
MQPVAPARPKRGSSAGGLLLAVAAVIAVGGIAFAVGRVTAPANASTAASTGFGNGALGGGGFANGSFAPGQNGAGFARRGGALATEATVTAVGPDSLTIKIGNGTQTIQVKTSAATTYHTQQAATASAVTVGSKVLLQFDESTGTTGAGGAAAPNASGAPVPNASGAPAPNASGFPGPGGFIRNFGTVKDVTVLSGQ